MLNPIQKRSADICLIVEDSYPYRQNGEATWVHQFVAAMPRVKFAIVHVGTNRLAKSRRGLKFKLPRNVTTVVDAFIFEDGASKKSRLKEAKSKASRPTPRDLKPLFEAVAEHKIEAILDSLVEIAPQFSFETFWAMPEVEEAISDLCIRDFPEEPFLDFVENAKSLLAPLWQTARQAVKLPKVDSYHVIGTGFAGLLGVMARRLNDKPLLVSELNITVRERIGELLRSEWADSARQERGVLRHLWIEFHLLAAKATYQAATTIVTPFQKNADYQKEFGADPEKIKMIPNGIDLSRFESVRRKRIEHLRVEPNRRAVGFLGRISPQKDLKTLIQAARITVDKIPNATFVIAGAKGDEITYFHECNQLVADLELTDHVSFPGHISPEKSLPDFDLLAACSIGDGQPLAILEAMASQIPIVATDVGDCDTLINGADGRKPAGLLVGIGDARRMADALINLLEDSAKRNRYGSNGRQRVEGCFPRKEMIQSFRDLYDGFTGRVTARVKKKPKPDDGKKRIGMLT